MKPQMLYRILFHFLAHRSYHNLSETDSEAWKFAGARKLLAETPAPSPIESGEAVCRDSSTGAVVSCQNSRAFIIIGTGMTCIMFLVTVALILLFWSIVKQRRFERRPGIVPTFQVPIPQSVSETSQSVTMNPSECDDCVFVLYPGDVRPLFFAIRRPILPDGGMDDDMDDDKSIAYNEDGMRVVWTMTSISRGGEQIMSSNCTGAGLVRDPINRH